MNPTPYLPPGAFPPPGWSMVGLEDALAVARAQELAAELPPSHYVDEWGDGACLRFFSWVSEDGRRGVGCIKWDGRTDDMLGDAAAASTAPASSGIDWTWVGVFAALGLAGFVIYAATRPLEARDASGYRGADRRRERDELAEQNIPDELLPLWRRERSRFKGSPHERSEAFLEWAETDEGDRARLELLEEASGERVEDLVLSVDGCRCKDQNAPRCCGRGCCSWHKGIKERIGQEVPF